MKFTNIKQLIIKFMGGGLINFPTRFLRWVKINGDTDDSDDGGSDGGGGSVDINTILDNISIKDDLLTKLQAIDYTNQDPDDGVLTNLTFDDVFNDYDNFIKSLLYREQSPVINRILFSLNDISIPLVVENPGIINLEISDESYSYIVYIIDINRENNIKIYAHREYDFSPA